MIIKNFRTVGYLKSRPKAHKLEGIMTKQHAGMVIASNPKPYPINSAQKRVRDAAASCGIKKGMSRAALVTAMRTCIPGKFGR
jgi:hypothetical protein